MPLPWNFSRNVLVPVRVADRTRATRAVFHVRVYDDRWAGEIVLAGRLGDQPLSVERALPGLWERLCASTPSERLRFVSYQPDALVPFRTHRSAADPEGVPLPAFEDDARPRDATARAVRLLQHGPAVDVWDASRYRLSTFQLARIHQRARRVR